MCAFGIIREYRDPKLSLPMHIPRLIGAKRGLISNL